MKIYTFGSYEDNSLRNMYSLHLTTLDHFLRRKVNTVYRTVLAYWWRLPLSQQVLTQKWIAFQTCYRSLFLIKKFFK